MPVPIVKLEVDLGTKVGLIRPLNGVNLGPIQMNGWLDFSDTYRDLKFSYTRLHDCAYAVPETVDVHSIFPIFDADPQDPNNYRFAITDDYIQSILDTGSQIIYRLGETIEHYTRRKYFIYPPKDYNKWATICVNIIRHYNEGWANGFHHNIRYWEIWNEPWGPGGCWMGTKEDYYSLYETAAKTIKAHNPNLMVGGPSSAGVGPETFGEEFLKHCRRTGAPLDFYTWHMYALDPVPIIETSAAVKKMLVRYGFQNVEIHLNEWNYLPSEGWLFNHPDKTTDVIRRAIGEISGVNGAVFDAATLTYMQDSPVDIANFYWARDGFWGLLDQYGAARKNFYAFKAFRLMLDTPYRVQTTSNNPMTGYALLAGLSEAPRAGILLSNFRARETDFALTVKNWPWAGKSICKRYLLDYDRNLTMVGQDVLDGENATINICMPPPALSYITIMPYGNE